MARLSKLPWLEIGILVLALFLRVVLLDIKPAHFDEGINGSFADRMTSTGYYQYDPTNFHGPLHFYGVFVSQTLFGRNLWALRLPAILASMLCVWMLLRFRPFFGATTCRLAALCMAVSPAFVFYGRYSIHESEQVLFSIIFLWGLLGLWRLGERKYLYVVILSVAGMVLTKETYAIHVGSFGLAALTLWLWEKLVPSRPVEKIVPQLWNRNDAILAGSLGLLSIIFFYSGTFLHFPMLHGLLSSFETWFHTGVTDAGHKKDAYQIWHLNYYWLYLMARYEWPALLGFVACVRYVAPSTASLRYLAIYGAGVLLAYSIIPYKTPWCIISILWPFYFLFSAQVVELAKTLPRQVPISAAMVIILVSLASSIRLNFFHYTDEKEPYVYVQTYEDIATLTEPLLEMAKRDERNRHMTGIIALESYYPLPWNLGDFTAVGYYNPKENPPASYDADFVVIQKSEEAAIEPKLTDAYYRRSFRLRDAQEECTAYFRRKVFAPWFGGVAEIQAPKQP